MRVNQIAVVSSVVSLVAAGNRDDRPGRFHRHISGVSA